MMQLDPMRHLSFMYPRQANINKYVKYHSLSNMNQTYNIEETIIKDNDGLNHVKWGEVEVISGRRFL